MRPNTLYILFSIRHFVATCTHNSKLQVVYGRCTYVTTALLSEMSIFCVIAGCEIRLASYGSKYASQCLFGKPFLCPYMHNLKTTGHMGTFSILNNCSTIGDIHNGV